MHSLMTESWTITTSYRLMLLASPVTFIDLESSQIVLLSHRPKDCETCTQLTVGKASQFLGHSNAPDAELAVASLTVDLDVAAFISGDEVVDESSELSRVRSWSIESEQMSTDVLLLLPMRGAIG